VLAKAACSRAKDRGQIDGNLLLATACDGTLATTALLTSVRIVCSNTLAIAQKNDDSAVKVSHRSQSTRQAVRRKLGIAVSS